MEMRAKYMTLGEGKRNRGNVKACVMQLLSGSLLPTFM